MIEKHQLIVSNIRNEIVNGKFSPNDRLPTSRELAAKFKASSVTVNRALSCLIKDGYIRTSGRHGTFVSSHPPHMYQYGLVCFSMDEKHSNFAEAVLNESKWYRRSNSRRLIVYSGNGLQACLESYERLVDDLAGQRLSGLIFLSSPDEFVHSPLWKHTDLPRVVVSQGAGDLHKDFPTVSQDSKMLLEQSLQAFFEGGKLSIGALFTPESYRAFAGEFESMLGQYSMVSSNHWMQVVDPGCPEALQGLISLMMSADQGNRPDGLLLFDESLVSTTTAALKPIGLHAPKDVQLVHIGSTLNELQNLPVVSFDSDKRGLIQQCFEQIEQMRHSGGDANRPSQKEREGSVAV